MDYEIKVQGELDAEWSGSFEEMTLTVEGREADHPITTLSGSVADQSALRGMLNRLWDLNLTLVSVHCYSGDRGGF
jgi:hypothetical protein